MKYLVSKTSVYNEKPCEGAYKVLVTIVDRRTVDCPSKLKYESNWYERGTNHRVENGKICRDLGKEEEWEVEIPDLLEFVKKHERCILRIEEGRPSIEIYDDYRE